MITRIVKLTFQPDKTDEFVALFQKMKNHISDFEGCVELKLMKSTSAPNIFFTISQWESERHLDNYRNSDFFEKVWRQAKSFFADRPEAWTLAEQ